MRLIAVLKGSTLPGKFDGGLIHRCLLNLRPTLIRRRRARLSCEVTTMLEH